MILGVVGSFAWRGRRLDAGHARTLSRWIADYEQAPLPTGIGLERIDLLADRIHDLAYGGDQLSIPHSSPPVHARRRDTSR